MQVKYRPMRLSADGATNFVPRINSLAMAKKSDPAKLDAPKYAPTYLAAWRKAVKRKRGKDLSQSELAAAVGIHNGHLSNVEQGKRQYTQEILEKSTLFLRQWFPALTVADLLTIDPNEPDAAALVDHARRVPESQREAARIMLRALADRGAAAFDFKPDAPPRPAPRKRR